jgi:hypoxanthine phosphoribosyltransferase
MEKSLRQIQNKLDNIVFQEEFDLVVAIGRGGVIPGFLISKKLKKDLELLWLRFRDDKNKIMFGQPRLIEKSTLKFQKKRVLLVDDVCKTGATLKTAKKYLNGAKSIKTFIINGKADYYLYDEKCFKFPWN